MDYPPNVFVRDKASFEGKVACLKKGGAKSLHVISDFDRTLTKLIGVRVHSLSYAPLNGCFRSDEYRKKVKDLFDFYHPIEINLSLPEAYKARMSDEWWSKYFDLVVEQVITEESFFEQCEIAISEAGYFREGIDAFFGLLLKKKIPVLIFSAGVTNAIEYYLKRINVLTPNVNIISNLLLVKEGVVVGYAKPLIQAYNKDERHLVGTKYKSVVEKRRNVILLGDSLGDLSMANGVEHDVVLNIGFLNHDVERSLKEYSGAYDALILNDGTLEFVNEVLKEVL